MIWNPKSLNTVCYFRSWEGVTASSGNLTAITDLSSSSNSFSVTGSPVISTDANGFNCIKFNTSTSISKSFPINGLLSTNNKSGWIVYKEEITNKYHNIIFMATKIVQEQMYIINDANSFTHVVYLNSLDTTNSKGIGISATSQEIRVSQWGSNGSKMVLCEFGLMNHDNFPIGVADINNLKAYFKARYADIDTSITTSVSVINQGVNGDNTSQVIARLSTINSYSGNLAIVMIGTNDWRHPTAGSRRTPAQYEANLTTIVQSLKANGSQVLLMNIPPILNQESDYVCPFYSLSTGCDANATGNQFRTKVWQVATAQNVRYFDLYQKFVDIGQPTYTVDSYMENALNTASTDGVHPRPNGALFIAQKIKEYLTENSLSYAKIVCIGDSITWGDGLVGGGTTTGQTYPAQLYNLLNNL